MGRGVVMTLAILAVLVGIVLVGLALLGSMGSETGEAPSGTGLMLGAGICLVLFGLAAIAVVLAT